MSACVRTAKKNKLQPWKVKSWCIGKPSGQYVAKMEDVLEVYQRPYDARYPVVCVDEISKELHDTPRGSLPMSAGQPLRQDYEYERHGTANLFLSVEPLRAGAAYASRSGVPARTLANICAGWRRKCILKPSGLCWCWTT